MILSYIIEIRDRTHIYRNSIRNILFLFSVTLTCKLYHTHQQQQLGGQQGGRQGYKYNANNLAGVLVSGVSLRTMQVYVVNNVIIRLC